MLRVRTVETLLAQPFRVSVTADACVGGRKVTKPHTLISSTVIITLRVEMYAA